MELKMGSGQNRMWSAVNWLGTRSKDRFFCAKDNSSWIILWNLLYVWIILERYLNTSDFVNQSTRFFRMSASFIRNGVGILFFNSTGLLHLICHSNPQLSSYRHISSGNFATSFILLVCEGCKFAEDPKDLHFIIQHCYCSSALNLQVSSLASVPRRLQLQYRKLQLHLNFFYHESQFFCALK